MKKITKVIKKIIFSVLIPYSYNLLAKSMNLIIPINFVTVGALTIFGVHSLFFLIALLFICF